MVSQSNLSNKEQYNTPENIILNANIYEYDIVKCNVSVLRAYGKITESEYRNYCEMPKQVREEAIGNIIRNENAMYGHSETHKLILAGKTEAKEKLFQMNDITDDTVVRIASDAVTINRVVPCYNLVIPIGNGNGTVTFKQNGPWHAFIRLLNIMVFFQKLPDGNFDVAVKGINDSKVHFHTEFLSFVGELISLMEIDKNTALRFFKDYYHHYIHMELPVGNYREFNAVSAYRIFNSPYGSMFMDESLKEKVDPNYNLNILRDLYRMILRLPS